MIASRDADRGQVPLLRGLMQAYARSREVDVVAVVGNAPLTPDSERARQIDESDLVIRVNGFALDGRGGPETVGTRADVVLFNRALRASPWFFDDYRRRLYLMVEPGRLHWEVERWPAWWPTDLGYVVVSNRDVILPLSEALGLQTRRSPVWATTGLVALWLARSLFPAARTIAAGFSMVDEPDQNWWSHAYGDGSPVGPEHVLRSEAALLKSWVADGSMTLLA